MDRSLRAGKYALAAVVGCAAVFYCLNLPQYVQGGDSGELVAAAFRLFVAHPPGYPLWIWIEHLFTHFLPLGSVFWRASLLSAVFACFTLLLIGLPVRRNVFALLVCLPILALSTAFAEAALIPDVFSLHALFVAAIGSLYLFSKADSKSFRFGVPFLFSLGFAHHLTTVLLFPVMIGVLIESRNNRRALLEVASGAALGGAAAVLLYGSLLALDTQSSFSWGVLSGASSVWHHFIRTDYGTFRLAADKKSGSLDGVGFFLRSSWLELCGLLGVSAVVHSKSRKPLFELRAWVWGSACLLAIAFFYLANVTPIGMGQEVLRRFFVMPMTQITCLAAYFVFKCEPGLRERRVAGLLAAIVIAILGIRAHGFVGLHSDSVFEDYAVNRLAQAGRHRPALVITGDDNAYFGMHYVQSVLEKNQDIGVISPTLFFHPWYLKKIQQVAPGFRLSGAERVWSTLELDIEKSLLEPNFARFSVVVSKGYQDGKSYHVKFLGLGRIVSAGSGVDFDDLSPERIELRTRLENRPQGPQGFSKAFLFSEYSYFYLEKGLFSFSEGHKGEAQRAWESALSRVPYAFPALINLCRIESPPAPRCGQAGMAEVQEESKEFF